MLGALALACALAAAGPSCGFVRGKPLDTRALVAELGVDGAIEALRIRIAGDPADVPARRALANLELGQGRKGAALEQLEAVWRIGGPAGVRLNARERKILADLLRARAEARVERGSPDALADLDAATDIGGVAKHDDELRRRATMWLALSELRSTDPEKRAQGAKRIAAIDAQGTTQEIYAAIADPVHAERDDLGAAGLFLWQNGARRIALERLDAWERAGGRESPTAPHLAFTVDAWLAARAWWRGPAGRPDVATLDRAVAQGGWSCWFATKAGELGCTLQIPLGRSASELLAIADRRGWRTSDPVEAAGWVELAHRQAVGWTPPPISMLDVIDRRVDLAALGIPADGEPRIAKGVPTWARGPMLRAAGHGAEAELAEQRTATDGGGNVLAPEIAQGMLAGDPPSDPAVVVARAIDPRGDHEAELAEVVRAFRRAPAAGDRAANDLAARDVDVAAIAPTLADLFLLLGDPARARGWMERAVESSPRDVELRAGLVRALAASGDGAAARLHLTTVAAGSGDAAASLMDGARALADAGLLIDAMAPAKLALELRPPGDQGDVLAFLVDVAGRLGRDEQVRTLALALARERPERDPTTLRARALNGDGAALARALAAAPDDPQLAMLAAAAEPDHERAAQILDGAVAASPIDVALLEARLARGPSEVARTWLARLATSRPIPQSLRVAAARAWLSAAAADATRR
jgi:tetratricopeptide (TPR) repeat protein